LRARFLFVLIVIFSATVWAADNVARLNIKEGLWEIKSTHTVTGAPSIPPESLAKMTPEQRAQVEGMMKQNGIGAPATEVRKECVTKEKLDKLSVFNDDRKNSKCDRNVVNSTGSKLEMKIHCQGSQHDTEGTFILEILSSDVVKGKSHFVTNAKGNEMNMDFTFDGRYLGAACGDVK
jgi:hypothetical protein